jgi:hypothetical protein
MGEWRDSGEVAELPAHLSTFIPADWVDFAGPYDPIPVGAQSPSLAYAPRGPALEPYRAGPPDPHMPLRGLTPPRSTWVDDQGRWWRDERFVEAHARYRAARRQWEDAHPEYVARLVREMIRRRLERQRLGTIHLPEDSA